MKQALDSTGRLVAACQARGGQDYHCPDCGRAVRLCRGKQKGAYWVTVNGKPVMRTLVKEVFDEAECAWYYDLSDRTIWVKYPNPSEKEYEVVVSTEKFDLVGMVLEEE